MLIGKIKTPGTWKTPRMFRPQPRLSLVPVDAVPGDLWMELGRLEQCFCILLPWICAVLPMGKAQPRWERTHRGSFREASFATFTGRGQNLPTVMNFHTGSGLLSLCPCQKRCILIPAQCSELPENHHAALQPSGCISAKCHHHEITIPFQHQSTGKKQPNLP